MKRLSNRCANVLEAQGVEEGDRVAMLLAQGPETAVAHLPTYKLGHIAVPLFTLFRTEAPEYRLDDPGARCVITEQPSPHKHRTPPYPMPPTDNIVQHTGRTNTT